MCLYHTEASWNKLFLYLLSSETCLDILDFSEEVHTNVANLIAGLKNFIMKDEEKRDDNDQNACVELRNLEFTQNISIQSFTWYQGLILVRCFQNMEALELLIPIFFLLNTYVTYFVIICSFLIAFFLFYSDNLWYQDIGI